MPEESENNAQGAASPRAEDYSPERVAEFLLTNAVDAQEYARAVARVKEMGLDPSAIPHVRPE